MVSYYASSSEPSQIRGKTVYIHTQIAKWRHSYSHLSLITRVEILNGEENLLEDEEEEEKAKVVMRVARILVGNLWLKLRMPCTDLRTSGTTTCERDDRSGIREVKLTQTRREANWVVEKNIETTFEETKTESVASSPTLKKFL